MGSLHKARICHEHSKLKVSEAVFGHGLLSPKQTELQNISCMQLSDGVLLLSAISRFERMCVSEFHPSIHLNLASVLSPTETLQEDPEHKYILVHCHAFPPGSSILDAAQVTEMKD